MARSALSSRTPRQTSNWGVVPLSFRKRVVLNLDAGLSQALGWKEGESIDHNFVRERFPTSSGKFDHGEIEGQRGTGANRNRLEGLSRRSRKDEAKRLRLGPGPTR